MKQVAIKVIPRARHNKIEGAVTDAAGKTWLQVRLTAAPEDGKANKALLRLLADTWGIPVSRLRITSGETSRYKVVTIDDR